MPFLDNSKKKIEPTVFGIPVSVIGDFKPLYLSLEDMYGNVCKSQIKDVKYKKNITGGISFQCSYIAGEQYRECTLNYYFQKKTWFLQ